MLQDSNASDNGNNYNHRLSPIVFEQYLPGTAPFSYKISMFAPFFACFRMNMQKETHNPAIAPPTLFRRLN